MAKKQKPKILFSFVDAGLGHITPTRGIADAFEKKYGKKCQVIRSYVFKESQSQAVQKMGALQDAHPKKLGSNKAFSFFEGLSYALPSKLVLFFLDRVFGKGRTDFFQDLKNLDADLVFSTYYLPTHLAQQANKKGLTDSIVVSYAPDPYVYPAWDRKCDLMFVLNEQTKRQAIRRGYKKEQIEVVPFVYRSEITSTTLNEKNIRKKLGIEKGRYALLFTAGAHATAGAEKIIKEIVKKDLDLDFYIVCGKNQRMYDKMVELSKSSTGKTNIKPLPFIDNLHEYMSVCNLAIGKSGLGTVMEAKYYGLPMIIFSEQSKVEQITAKYLSKNGIAIREHNVKKIIEIISRDVENNGYANGLLKQEIIREQSGAEAVADRLFELLKQKHPQLK